MKFLCRQEPRPTDRPWGRRIAMGLVWSAFLVMIFHYARNHLRYRGVETWPSVDAVLLEAWNDVRTSTGYGRWGQTSGTSLDFSGVHFHYTVNGVRYDGYTASPDRKSLPVMRSDQPWKAYYNPESPDVAVLAPYPYSGGSLPMIICFVGIFLAMHLYFILFLPSAELKNDKIYKYR